MTSGNWQQFYDFLFCTTANKDMCNVEEYVNANYRRMAGFGNSKKVPRKRWKPVDLGVGEKTIKGNSA